MSATTLFLHVMANLFDPQSPAQHVGIAVCSVRQIQVFCVNVRLVFEKDRPVSPQDQRDTQQLELIGWILLLGIGMSDVDGGKIALR
ncbi:hypothetical protein DVH05_015284 [Phytophthora capsici]|nr:hypothetical protein DVH05_015284 [Phytophthora capsici]